MPTPRHNKIARYLFCLVFLLVMGVGVVGAEIPSVEDSVTDQLGLMSTANESGFSGALPESNPDFPTVSKFIGEILGLILSLLGVVFIVLIIFSGYMWIIARGNEEDAQKAKDIMLNAVIGVVIVFSAYVISQFFMKNLYQATVQQ